MPKFRDGGSLDLAEICQFCPEKCSAFQFLATCLLQFTTEKHDIFRGNQFGVGTQDLKNGVILSFLLSLLDFKDCGSLGLGEICPFRPQKCCTFQFSQPRLSFLLVTCTNRSTGGRGSCDVSLWNSGSSSHLLNGRPLDLRTRQLRARPDLSFLQRQLDPGEI